MPYFCQSVRSMVCAKKTSLSWSAPFCFRSLVVCICSKSVRIPFNLRSKSVRIFHQFQIHFHLLYVAVYDFYSLLKSAHAHQKLTCGRKKERIFLFPILIVLAPASQASLNHTLCLHVFCYCSSDFVIVLFARSWL